jgi:proline iminopeptidase
MTDVEQRPATEPSPAADRTAIRRSWTGTARQLLDEPWAAAAVVVIATLVYGVAAAWWTPRGPVTTTQAVGAVVLSTAAGLAAGRLLRTRWSMLLAPVGFAASFELARASTSGPLVDGIHLGSTYGIVAFVSGRGLHGVLALLPMVVGAACGAAAGRRRAGAERTSGRRTAAGRLTRRTITAVITAGLLLLVAGLLRPASTAPILAANGGHLRGSVAELTRVRIGGHDLAILIRGNSTSSPVLLYLAGGPGGTDMGAMRRHGNALERDFVVATYDQRGAGKSYDQLEPRSTITLAAAVSDTIEVSNYLRNRFHQDKIYLVGNSWGSMLGVLAAQQHPELYQAFVGAGQMVDIRATDRIYYQDTLAWARSHGRSGLVETLLRNGPPPYQDLLKYDPVLNNEQLVYPYDDTVNEESSGGFSTNLFVREYTLMEQLHSLGATLDVITVLYPQLQGVDFRASVPALEIPVYLVQGRYETRGRAEPAQQWFDLLRAPHKQLVTFPTAGHRTLFEQPEMFAELMRTTVLTQTRATS